MSRLRGLYRSEICELLPRNGPYWFGSPTGGTFCGPTCIAQCAHKQHMALPPQKF